MTWLWLILEIAVEAFAAWTIAVHACMVLDAPAAAAWPAFAIGVGTLHYASRGRWRAARAAGRGDARQSLVAIALGLVFTIPALLLVTPTGDDFNFFHRAAWQLAHLAEPFTTADTAFSAQGLQAISPLHVLTTWELGIAMAAKLLGLDPLGVYHNGTLGLTSVLLACMFVLWLRELGFGASAAYAGAFAAFVFFAVDDPSVRSYAIAWRMLWVGKMVQWLLLFPLSLLFAWRYLRGVDGKSGLRGLLHPFLCGVAAVGLSGTGVFLLPGIFAAASMAAALSGPIQLERVLRCGALNLASLYCFAVAAFLISGTLDSPSDMSAWTESFPIRWFDSLFLVFGHTTGLARSVFLAFVVPAVVLRGAERRFVCLYALGLVAIFANPVTGPIWVDAAQPGSYWRVALLLPVSLGVAVAAAAAATAFLERRAASVAAVARVGTPLAVAVAIASVGLIVASRVVTPSRKVHMHHESATKSPLALRLPAAHTSFLHPVRNELEGRRLLAAPGISTSAPLLLPTIAIDAARLKDTRHVFANAGRAAEGELRLAAWRWAGRCTPDPVGARAAAALLAEGTNALIVRDCEAAPGNERARVEAERAALLDGAAGRWLEVSRANGFVLYLRQ